MDLEEIRRYLRRTAWGEFPDVLIYAEVNVVKLHPHFANAKSGDAEAAEALIEDVLATGSLDGVRAIVRERRPKLVAVHAVETAGGNAIPRAFARRLSKSLDLPVASGIIQVNRVMHTGADGYHRLAFPALFDGQVEAGEYLIVDDFVGQGGTVANIRGHVEANGGSVIGAVSLSGKTYSANLTLREETLSALRIKHGENLEEWWSATFGYSFERLTESEARYLSRVEDADTIRARLAAAKRTGDR